MMPLRHAFEAEAALQEMLGVMNLDVLGRGPTGAVAAEVPLLTFGQPAIDKQVFHAVMLPKTCFFLDQVKTLNVLRPFLIYFILIDVAIRIFDGGFLHFPRIF